MYEENTSTLANKRSNWLERLKRLGAQENEYALKGCGNQLVEHARLILARGLEEIEDEDEHDRVVHAE